MSIFRRKRLPELQRLLDQAEILALMGRYARAVDRRDFDLLRTCYHPDAFSESQNYVGDIDGFVAVHEAAAPFLSMTHFLGNHEVEIDGDVAFAETLCISSWREAEKDGKPERDTTGFVRYCDRLERRQGEWRIAHRVIVREPGRIDDVQTPKPWNGRGIREVSPRDILRPPALRGGAAHEPIEWLRADRR